MARTASLQGLQHAWQGSRLTLAHLQLASGHCLPDQRHVLDGEFRA